VWLPGVKTVTRFRIERRGRKGGRQEGRKVGSEDRLGLEKDLGFRV
jgi:hypothetical protein